MRLFIEWERIQSGKGKGVGQPGSSRWPLAPGSNMLEEGPITLIPKLILLLYPLTDLSASPAAPQQPQQSNCRSDISILLLIKVHLLPTEFTVASMTWKMWTCSLLIFPSSLLYAAPSVHDGFLLQLSPSSEVFFPLPQIFT